MFTDVGSMLTRIRPLPTMKVLLPERRPPRSASNPMTRTRAKKIRSLRQKRLEPRRSRLRLPMRTRMKHRNQRSPGLRRPKLSKLTEPKAKSHLLRREAVEDQRLKVSRLPT